MKLLSCFLDILKLVLPVNVCTLQLYNKTSLNLGAAPAAAEVINLKLFNSDCRKQSSHKDFKWIWHDPLTVYYHCAYKTAPPDFLLTETLNGRRFLAWNRCTKS